MHRVIGMFAICAACGSTPGAEPDAGGGGDLDATAIDAQVVDGQPVDASDPTFTPPCAQLPCTVRVSVSSDELQGNAMSWDLPTLSDDGQWIAFRSEASNLVADDHNNTSDVFLRDVASGTTIRVSSGATGEGNGSTQTGWVSRDGRFITFTSAASNLVANDTNSADDGFLYERTTGDVTLVTVGTGGVLGNSGSSIDAPSRNGRRVTFSSYATNLVGVDTNASIDTFVRDLDTNTITCTSNLSNGASIASTISDDGTLVALYSSSSDLVANDTNNAYDVFLRDLSTGELTRISKSSTDAQANGASCCPTFSLDADEIAFSSLATNLVTGDTNGRNDAFVRTRSTNSTERVSRGIGGAESNGHTENPKLSADGRYVMFVSAASNLVPDDTNGVPDAFVFDRMTQTTTRVSVGDAGQQGNGRVNYASFAGNGRAVVFASEASNVVIGDTNGVQDIFVHYLPPTIVVQ